jgi:antitoxin ParD1/3/4
MARNTSVSLGDHFTGFIDEQVASGRYASASDVIRAGLRLLEHEVEQYAWMRARLAESDADLEAGRVHEESDEFWEEIDREVDERVKRRKRVESHAIS